MSLFFVTSTAHTHFNIYLTQKIMYEAFFVKKCISLLYFFKKNNVKQAKYLWKMLEYTCEKEAKNICLLPKFILILFALVSSH